MITNCTGMHGRIVYAFQFLCIIFVPTRTESLFQSGRVTNPSVMGKITRRSVLEACCPLSTTLDRSLERLHFGECVFFFACACATQVPPGGWGLGTKGATTASKRLCRAQSYTQCLCAKGFCNRSVAVVSGPCLGLDVINRPRTTTRDARKGEGKIPPHLKCRLARRHAPSTARL